MFTKLKYRVWRYLLAYTFSKVYDSPEGRERLRNEINAETWFGGQSETGGHALGIRHPLSAYEIISIKCVLTDSKSMNDNVSKTNEISYWKHEWKD